MAVNDQSLNQNTLKTKSNEKTKLTLASSQRDLQLLALAPPLEWLAAPPNNFSPPPPAPPESFPVVPELSPSAVPDISDSEPFFGQPESLTIDFRRDLDNFDRFNIFFEPTAKFRLPNGDALSVTTGANYFDQDEVEPIFNVPVRLGWEGKINTTTVAVAGGADFFDRLPVAPYLNVRVEHPLYLEISPQGELSSGLFVSGQVTYEPYKFNARTLENEVQTLRVSPSLYWQIDPDTSLFSTFRYGDYSDDNQEFQSFSRLERKLGQFFVAANLFTWRYTEDVQDTQGYFSPPDFLVYTGEVGWEGEVTDFLRCRLAATFGQQRLEGNFDFANSYQGRCTALVADTVELDLGYAFSNVFNRDPGDSAYNNREITGQLRFKF